MSTITQVGSYAKYLGLVRNLTAGQTKVDDLSRQLMSGVKSVDMNAFGAETQKLLELRAELVKRDNYVKNIDAATTRLKGYDVVLNTLETIAADWQSNNMLPYLPGPPTVTSPHNTNPDALKVSVNQDHSKFTQTARYTVTAVPSQTGPNGTFDVTVTDGLGGKSTRSINLKTTPPADGGGYNFPISGGPGEGALLNLTFDKLTAASSSTFSVTWPQADNTLSRVEGAMREIQQLLNEQMGDRYLFAGSRYGTEPVGDLLAHPQTSKVTLNGAMVNAEDYFELSIDGRIFSYQVQPGDPKTVDFVAGALNSQIQAAKPPLPVTTFVSEGVITVVGNEPGRAFDIRARVENSMNVDNSVTAPTTLQTGTLPDLPLDPGLPQKDAFTLTGKDVDIGDTFEFTIAVGDPEDIYNQKYYRDHPEAPEDLPVYRTYTVRYTVSEQDFNAGVVDVSKVADKLREQFRKLDPAPPVATDDIGDGATIRLTANSPLDPNHPTRTSQFTTSARVVNGKIDNTISVATLPMEADAITDMPYVDPPELPFYDSEYMSNRRNGKAWEKASVTADDGLSVTYGVTSDDRAFQKLVSAFRMARVAASNPGKYEEYIGQARELLSQAKDEVRSVHAKVASDLATMESKKTAHTQAMAGVTEGIAKIEGIDETEVAARLRASMNALEAAYTVAGQTQKLSLLNYIA